MLYKHDTLCTDSQPVERAGSEVCGTYSGHYTKNVCNEAWYGLIFGSFGTHRLFGGEIQNLIYENVYCISVPGEI